MANAGAEVLESLLRALRAATPLQVVVDDDAGGRPSDAACSTDSVADVVAAHPDADLVRLSGRPNWHSATALLDALTARDAGELPAVVVEAALPFELLPGERPHVHEVERQETVKAGLRRAITAYAARLGPDAVVVSCPVDPAFWAALPVRAGSALDSWIAARASLLDELDAVHRERVVYMTRSADLMELLERSQRSATAIVRSGRFRIGTRLVRLARRVRRREEFFPAPSRVLRRQVTVDRLGEQLGLHERPTVAVAPDALRVTYVLPDLRRSGGGLAVTQLVNDLRLLGVDARVATWRVRGEASRIRLLAPPRQFDSEAALIRDLPESDVIVATHWSSAPVVRALLERGRGTHGSYLIQDYEAWFYAESDEATRARVRETYAMIPDRIVTSSWLQELVAKDGFEATKITSGVDLDIYSPRSEPAGRPMVLAMARPRTPRRGFDTLVDALTRVHAHVSEVDIVLFGEEIRSMKLPFPFRATGVISNPDRLARLYSRARVFVDTSDFQAFGRAALEAMGCGAVPVLTDAGGVGEYATDGQNALLVGPRDPAATADAVIRIVTDDRLHTRMRVGGLSTVRRHSAHRDAVTTLEHLRGVVQSDQRL